MFHWYEIGYIINTDKYINFIIDMTMKPFIIPLLFVTTTGKYLLIDGDVRQPQSQIN